MDHLRNLVFVSASGRASEYRELWTNWRYSDIVEFNLMKSESFDKDIRDIDSADVEYSEQLTTVLLYKIFQRIS